MVPVLLCLDPRWRRLVMLPFAPPVGFLFVGELAIPAIGPIAAHYQHQSGRISYVLELGYLEWNLRTQRLHAHCEVIVSGDIGPDSPLLLDVLLADGWLHK